jgi:hypothetical protein
MSCSLPRPADFLNVYDPDIFNCRGYADEVFCSANRFARNGLT